MQKLKSIMSKALRVPADKISDVATMKDVPGWDSLTHMDLILAIEQAFGVQLSGDDIADMQSVPMIVQILQKHNAA